VLPAGCVVVIARLFGGIGNQMFQYAAGRALALRTRSPFRVDVADCTAHRGYELSHAFVVDARVASVEDMEALLGWRRRRKVRRLLAHMPVTALRGAYVPEPHFHYWPGYRKLGGRAYLDGYWQSAEYFSDVEADVRAWFRFRRPLRGANAAVAAMIEQAPASVSVHVRRGDYVADPEVARIHGTNPVDYYERARARLAERLESDPRFFVFSDDMGWARAHLELPSSTVFVDHNQGSDSHFDLQLMARCRHHIIANSSFSWWGAWLDPSNAKIVIAPSSWFRVGHDTSTLLPAGWIRV